jgi:hypothetical protein
MVQKTHSHFIGTWRLLEMVAWDANDFDREVTAYISSCEGHIYDSAACSKAVVGS